MLVGAAALTRQWLSGAGCCRLRCGLGPARLAAPWQPFYEDVVPDRGLRAGGWGDEAAEQKWLCPRVKGSAGQLFLFGSTRKAAIPREGRGESRTAWHFGAGPVESQNGCSFVPHS